MKKILFCAAALTAVMMASCSKEDNANNNPSDGNAIEFRGVVEKADSRASVIGKTADLTSFYVQADRAGDNDFSFLKASVTKESATSWSYGINKYYPADGTALNFYAYAPIKDVNMTTDMDIAGGEVTFGYTVPADQSVLNTSTDLLVSNALGKTTGIVAFTFDHALTAATFSAKNLNPTTSELTYVIEKIEITELDNVGTFTYGATFAASTWENDGDADVTYKAGLPASGVAVVPGTTTAVKLLSANDVMMILPQTPAKYGDPTDAASIALGGTFVEVTYSLKDGSGQYIYESDVRYLKLPANFEFKKGKRYNFEFEFAAANAIEMTVTDVNAWDDETVTQ